MPSTQPGAADREAAAEQQRQQERVAEAPFVVMELLNGGFDDLEPVSEHVDEDEREDTHREHRERDPAARRKDLKSAHGKPQEDRESSQGSQQNSL